MMVLEQRLITQMTQYTFNINNETTRWGLWRPGNQTYDHQKGAAHSWPQIILLAHGSTGPCGQASDFAREARYLHF